MDGISVSMWTTIVDGTIQDVFLSQAILTATGAAGQNWKQSYVYGAGEERISMSYSISGDESSDWEPTAGASGAGAGSAAPKTLFYLSDGEGSVIGLEGQELLGLLTGMGCSCQRDIN